MLKRLGIASVVVAVFMGIAVLVMAGGGEAERQRKLELSQQYHSSVPPEVLAIPTPVGPVTATRRSLPYPYPIRPRFSGPCRVDPELFSYITDRSNALETMVAIDPQTMWAATVNFKRPVSQAELNSLAGVYSLEYGKIRYVTNTDITGGCYQCDLDTIEARLRADHGDHIRIEGVTSVRVHGSLGNLQQLNQEPSVLLVDLSELVEFAPGKKRVEYPMQISWRYERACPQQQGR